MPTTLIRSLHPLSPAWQGSVMTIGNFDGVHVGHQRLLAKVLEEAKARQRPSLVMTFEPHPFEFFAKADLHIPRITRFREKYTALAESGVNGVIVIKFNQQLASISASDFVKRILYEALHPTHLIVGDDFHFGHQRQGDIHLLTAMGRELQFSVEAMPTCLIEGERVSSTRVRKALSQGDLKRAERLLGRPYAMMGRIRRGDQLGRALGFPTANIDLHRRLTPVKGVYTVYVHGISEHPWPGAANIGTRPTIDGTRTLLEVHLLDFHQDIYGRYVRVEFCKKLRDEERYPNLQLLKEQIANDVAVARDYFK